MVKALGAVSLTSELLAIFAFRIGWLMQSDAQTGMKPPLTWEEQDIRQFLGRVFGPDVVARVAALPAFWFNNNSWKDIQEHLFKYAVHAGGATLGAAIIHALPGGFPVMATLAVARGITIAGAQSDTNY
mmetsp:Transcript_37998/g.87829  ORF Transcript_37998/g.87829 Transcript_37998/m.87829 type:complete len:129 (-) Transcript_37998:29-415(-)